MTNQGGAIYNGSGDYTINDVEFFGNSATQGGAIYDRSGNHTINNVKFSGNRAQLGGALYFNTWDQTINNASFSGNSATQGGAILLYESSITLTNSIIWNNSSSIERYSTPVSKLTITHSLVQECKPGGIWNTTNCGTDGGGNLVDSDPLFVNPIDYTKAPTTTGDLHLQPNSPAIDKGDNSLNPLAEDLDGKPRIIGSAIDLGAYETGHHLETGVIGNGEIKHTPISDWHSPNTTVTLTATAKPGWSFAGWSGDLSGSSSPMTLLIDNRHYQDLLIEGPRM